VHDDEVLRRTARAGDADAGLCVLRLCRAG
jgi:hypothetical protein